MLTAFHIVYFCNHTALIEQYLYLTLAYYFRSHGIMLYVRANVFCRLHCQLRLCRHITPATANKSDFT